MENKCPKIYKKLMQANNKFLENVQDKFSSQIIVGSVAYGRYTLLKETSDLDCILTCPKDAIYQSIKHSYFDKIVDAKLMQNLVDSGKVDYIKVKFDFEGVEFNVEIVPEEFFYKVCTMDLVNNLSTDFSKCYINYRPGDHYYTSDFSGRKVKIKYKYSALYEGYILDLPIHHISIINNESFYSYGFLVIKLLIPWIMYGHYHIKMCLEQLFSNVANRLQYEKNLYQNKCIEFQMSNLFVRTMPQELIEMINECAEMTEVLSEDV